MRKVLLLILFFLLTALYWVQAQTIKVEQYTVLLERTVTRTNVGCLQYEYMSHAGAIECIDRPSACCQNNTDNYGWDQFCLHDDPTCNECGGNEYISLKIYMGSINESAAVITTKSIGGMQQDE